MAKAKLLLTWKENTLQPKGKTLAEEMQKIKSKGCSLKTPQNQKTGCSCSHVVKVCLRDIKMMNNFIFISVLINGANITEKC